MVLFVGEWQRGQSYSYRFELVAPAAPFTYDGHHLNIDWVVRANVDLPLSRDPNVEVGFDLVPGGRQTQVPSAILARRAQSVSSQAGLSGCLTFLGLALLLVGTFTPPVGWLFAVVGGAMAFFGLRNKLAEQKLGQIHAVLRSEVIHPGTTLPIELSMSPRAGAHLRSIKAILTGQERVVKGSGKSSTTKTHVLCKETKVFQSPGTLTPGKPVSLDLEVEIPNIPAYTFQAPNNQINWTLVVRIDIAKWPDWVKGFPVVMWPQGDPAASRSPRALPPATPPKRPEAAEPPPDPVFREPSITPVDLVKPAAVTTKPFEMKMPELAATDGAVEAAPQAPITVRGPVFGLIDELLALPSYSSDHWDIIAKHKDEPIELELIVDHCEFTFSFDVPDSLEGGRTVHGTLIGSKQAVSIALPKDRNEEADRWKSGEGIQLTARPAKWNTLFSRLELHA